MSRIIACTVELSGKSRVRTTDNRQDKEDGTHELVKDSSHTTPTAVRVPGRYVSELSKIPSISRCSHETDCDRPFTQGVPTRARRADSSLGGTTSPMADGAEASWVRELSGSSISVTCKRRGTGGPGRFACRVDLGRFMRVEMPGCGYPTSDIEVQLLAFRHDGYG